MKVGEGRVREGDFTEGFENGKGNDSKNALSECNEKPRGKCERCERIFERNLERLGVWRRRGVREWRKECGEGGKYLVRSEKDSRCFRFCGFATEENFDETV